MLLFALVPFLCWILLIILIYHGTAETGRFTRLRISSIAATVIHGLLLAVFTEGLSYFSLITFAGVLTCWLVTFIALAGFIAYKRIAWWPALREITMTLVATFKLSWKTWVIALIVLVSLFLAVLYPPNNYDSMTYHMARVAHWIQNKNISHYQTHILRQLVYQPFAEWEILHFQVLTGGDRFANSVQLFYFVACISAISLITKELGGNLKQQLSSAFFAAMIPMAIIESNTTQNDIVVAFFVIAFIYYTILISKNFSYRKLLLAGVALGLAFLTKGTSYICVILFCGWYGALLLKDYQLPFKQLLRKAAIYALVPLLAVVLNAGFFYRNIFLNGSPLGEANKDTGNGGMSLKSVAFVAVKNVMNHLPVTGNMKATVTSKATALGVDINDPNYSFMPINWMYEGIYYHEDYMQNFIHTLLILLVCLFFFFKRSLYNNRLSYYTLFVFTIMGTSLLYCLLLKWQPWSNRLQIALFMSFCVLLGMEIGRLKAWLQLPFYLVIMYYSAGALFTSSNHPFPINKAAYRYPFDASLLPNAVKECQSYLDHRPHTKLSLYMGADSWDYPYYRYLSHSNGINRTIKHFMVNNESLIYLDNFIPDALITIETGRDKYEMFGKVYYRTKVFKDAIAIFEPK